MIGRPTVPGRAACRVARQSVAMRQARSARSRWPCVVLGTLVCALPGCGGAPPEKSGGPPVVHVRVTPVRRGTVRPMVSAVGTVVAIEVSRVAAGAPGKVIEYPFREGALVEANQVLARLRDVTLSIQLEGARQNLLERQHQLSQLQAGFRPQEIAQAEARSRSTEAAVGLATTTLRRVQELYELPERAVTDQELDRAQFELERARQDHAAAAADFDLKQAGSRPEEIAQAEAALAAQRQVVAEFEDEMEKRTIRAPFRGYLVLKHTELGEWVNLGGTVATLARLDEVEVRVNVEEAFVHQVHLGQTLDVAIDAWPGEKFPGTVQAVIPKAQWEQGSRSFPVIVRLANPVVDSRPRLNEGMVARVHFEGEPRSALLVDKDAVVRLGKKATVYVIGADRQAHPVEVTEGLSLDNTIAVEGNLHEGDLLATEGVERLRPLVEVVVEHPADDRSGAANQAARESVDADAARGGE